jgi:hypothetical protein
MGGVTAMVDGNVAHTSCLGDCSADDIYHTGLHFVATSDGDVRSISESALRSVSAIPGRTFGR